MIDTEKETTNDDSTTCDGEARGCLAKDNVLGEASQKREEGEYREEDIKDGGK